jgi:lipopolysaccharide exporter
MTTSTPSLIRIQIKYLLEILQKNSVVLIGSNSVTLVARIFSTMILTRLLDASAFGAVGMITTFAVILVMVTDLGFYPFVVRSAQADNSDFLDKVWTIRLCRSLALTIIFIALAKPLALYVGVPGLEYAFAAGSLILILDGATSMAFATAARGHLVRRLAMLDLSSALITTFSSILLAIYIRNYWSIISGILIGAAVKMVLSYAIFPDSGRRLVFDRAMFREVWQFGRFIMPSSVITLLIGQSDKLVLARLFDLKTFGLYSLASNLAVAPLHVMSSYTARILYPALVKGHSEQYTNLGDLFYRAGFVIRIFFMAACGFAICSTPIMIAILYDDRYIYAAKFMSILLITSLFDFVLSTENELFVAIGKIRSLLYFNMFRLAAILVLGPIFYQMWGPLGLVWAFAAAACSTQIVMLIAMKTLGMLRLRSEAMLWSAVLAGMIAGYTAVVFANQIWHEIPLFVDR